MAIEWKYKIEIADQSVFEEVAAKRNISFPDELKQFIVTYNAAAPSNKCFMIGNNERIFESVLSFNHNEIDTYSADTALSVIEDCNLIPFGIDPFGNYICYSLSDNSVVFWDHETGYVSSTGASLKRFIESLY